MNYTDKIDENIGYLDKRLGVDISFDIVRRDMIVCEKRCCFYFVDGMTKDDALLKIMDLFMKLQNFRPNTFNDLKTFFNTYIPYIEVEETTDKEKTVKGVLSGAAAMLVDGLAGAILIDTRTYPVRSISEPENDKVLRGSRVGFVETLVFNTALIRRHIRDENLVMSIQSVGKKTKTDVVISYIKDKADEKFVKGLIKEISNINIESLSLANESLAECLIKKKWYNPFPKIRYTERPDAAAASLMEGSVIVICDNSPSCMILPTSIFDFMQETDDFYFPPFTGTYFRISRIVVAILTVFAIPIWYLVTQHPWIIPDTLSFINVIEKGELPIFLQIIILEFAIDGLKLAALNTPSMLSGSFSIIGGLLLGDLAINVGWFIPETILYVAFVSIANFSQPSYELGYAFKFSRIFLLIMCVLFDIWGFIIGTIIVFWLIATNKSVKGSRSYLYPLIPFNAKAMGRFFVRRKLK